MDLKIDKSLSTWIKFGSALTVALHHYSQYVCANHIADSFIYKLFSSLGGFIAVAVFFFLSGYGVMESEKHKHLGLLAFLKKRWLRIYLPAVLVTLFWLPIKSFLSSEQLLTGAIYKLLWGFEDGVLWFVKVLLIQYLAFGLYNEIRVRCNSIISIVSLDLLTLCTIATVLLLLKMPDYCLLSIPMFTIGVLASIFNTNKAQMTGVFLILWGLTMCLLFFCMESSYVIHTLIVYSFVFMALWLIAKFPLKKQLPVPSIINEISFDIYLVHNKVLWTLKLLLPIVPLYYFAGLAVPFVLLFYRVRKKLNL